MEGLRGRDTIGSLKNQLIEDTIDAQTGHPDGQIFTNRQEGAIDENARVFLPPHELQDGVYHGWMMGFPIMYCL